MSKISQYNEIKKSLAEIQKLKENALKAEANANMDNNDKSIISELNQREKDLNVMLENF